MRNYYLRMQPGSRWSHLAIPCLTRRTSTVVALTPSMEAGSSVAKTYHRTHGIRYFHGCYCVGDDQR